MLVYFTDAVSGEAVAINPKHVTCVFTAKEGEMQGKTVISVTNGNLVVTEDMVNVVGVLQGQL